MGWLIYDRSVADPQAECERICSWDNDDSSGRCLASAIVGSTFYAAHEKIEKATGEKLVLAIVLLIKRSPFGYKDMDETMGPNEDHCPRRVMEKLDPLPPVPVVTNWTECTHCAGSGKCAAPNAHFDCWNCEGRGKVPTDHTQRDCYVNARAWRKRCWARLGGEPQGRQVELAI